MENKALSNLKKLYNIDTKTQNHISKPIPTKTNDKGNAKPIEYNSDMQKMYDYFLNKCLISQEDLKQKTERYELLRRMYRENTIIFLAVEMLADESITVQDNTNFITVKAKSSKFEKKINELLNSWNINQSTAKNQFISLYLFGDTFKFRKITNKGIEGFNFLSVFDINKRLEFNPLKMDDYFGCSDSINVLSKNFKSINDLVSAIENKDYENLSNMLDSFLIGWELKNGMLLPPWLISHAKIYSTESEFYPYGRSMFVNSLSAYLQLRASKNLMVMARANNFPIEIFTLKPGEFQSESEKWTALNKFIQNYNNFTSSQTNAEEKGIKNVVYAIQDLFDYRIETPNLNLDDIADIEMLELDLMRPTGIPLDLILGRGSNFSSGKLLSNQNLFFKRKITAGKSAFLQNLMEDIKVHFAIVGEEIEDFELEMESPKSEQEDDYFRTRESALQLITAIIDNIKQATGIEDNVILPKEVILDIFNKYSFLDVEDSESIINSLYKQKEELDKEGGDENGSDNNYWESKGLPNKLKFTEKDYNKLNRVNDIVIRESYFEAKNKLNICEGFKSRKQFINSNYQSSEIDKTLDRVKDYVKKDFINKKSRL